MVYLEHRGSKEFFITRNDFKVFIKERFKDRIVEDQHYKLPDERNWTKEKVGKTVKWVINNVLDRHFYNKKGFDYIVVRDTIRKGVLTGYVSYAYNVSSVKNRIIYLFGVGNILDSWDDIKPSRQEKKYMLSLLEDLCNSAEEYINKPLYCTAKPVEPKKHCVRGYAHPVMRVLN